MGTVSTYSVPTWNNIVLAMNVRFAAQGLEVLYGFWGTIPSHFSNTANMTWRLQFSIKYVNFNAKQPNIYAFAGGIQLAHSSKR